MIKILILDNFTVYILTYFHKYVDYLKLYHLPRSRIWLNVSMFEMLKYHLSENKECKQNAKQGFILNASFHQSLFVSTIYNVLSLIE